ncbi:MAG: siderophore-interacting protein [Microbacterium sp.]
MPDTVAPVRPAYRPFVVTVSRVRRLSDHFVRVTFSGDDLEWFGTGRLDQRVKVVFPLNGRIADVGQREGAGDWYDRWRALPHDQRNSFRTYTVRRIDPDARELDIDFVVHHDAGPAGAWAATAAVGDGLVIVGPDERSENSRLGIDWHPGTARRVLLAGDETAAPAICAILEALGSRYEADAFVEVPAAGDALAPAIGEGVRLHWLARDDAPHGEKLIAAMTAWTESHTELLARAAAPRPQQLADIDVDRDLLWDAPQDAEGEFYAWIAGEASTVKTLRRLLVTGCGVDRKRVAFMGYWRNGQAERAE